MGYELTRFIGDVDEEFLCSICTSVLEDPVQTQCEHLFCCACINDWLSMTESCPTDRKPLTISDIKPANRPFRNLWNKLEITCDFQPDGCSAIIQLEHLATHVGSCEYNLNSEIVCDKGCSMTITRGEYKINNCFAHLASRVSAQEKEITKLTHELSDQKDHYVRIANGQQGKLNGQQDEIRKLNDEVRRQRSQLEHFESVMSRQQQQQTPELRDETKISFRPLKWRQCENVKIEGSNILKKDNPLGCGIVQSEYPLEPTKSSFMVHVLGISALDSIGLNSDGRCRLIHYYSDGRIFVDGAKVHEVPKWKVGEIIECGMKFPDNFIDDGNHSARVYFSRNQETIFEKSLTIPKNGVFPIISIHGKGTKLQYFHVF